MFGSPKSGEYLYMHLDYSNNLSYEIDPNYPLKPAATLYTSMCSSLWFLSDDISSHIHKETP